MGKLNVIVIGAGTGGLALAHGLRAAGVSVRVFERDRKLIQAANRQEPAARSRPGSLATTNATKGVSQRENGQGPDEVDV